MSSWWGRRAVPVSSPAQCRACGAAGGSDQSSLTDVISSARPASPQDNGYVMVGDSHNNDSTQFRDVSARHPDYGMLSHQDRAHFLFKIEPVTFQGFYPARISKDTDGVYTGQNLTVVGYGTNDPTDGSLRFPGEAYEVQFQVAGVWDKGFRARAPGAGPCKGAYRVWCISVLECIG